VKINKKRPVGTSFGINAKLQAKLGIWFPRTQLKKKLLAYFNKM